MLKAHAAMLFVIFAGAAAAGGAAAEQLDRQQLIGAWRLVAIDYRGPHGETRDPFYQPDSSGLIVYDASGWMSVQISAAARGHLAVPAVRTGTRKSAASNVRKTRAFDSYYAYFGTWDIDATGLLTHHLQASLLPAEVGVDYTQSATLEAGRLVFTNTSGTADAPSVRKKIWERLAAAPDRP